MIKFKNYFVLLMLSIFLTAGYMFYLKLDAFSVELLLCDKSNGDCSAIAKFQDFETCERMNEKWGWICDEDDPASISCRVEEGVLAFSYCKN